MENPITRIEEILERSKQVDRSAVVSDQLYILKQELYQIQYLIAQNKWNRAQPGNSKLENKMLDEQLKIYQKEHQELQHQNTIMVLLQRLAQKP